MSDDPQEQKLQMEEMELELSALRARNQELERVVAGSLRASHGHAMVSPLVLSPSSVPPGEENILQKQIQTLNKTEDDLISQLHKKDEKIDYLEKNLTLYKKKLRQTEELLYELQWEPSEDMALTNRDDRKLAETRLEKKFAQLMEQMRIMEKGLREKQIIIEEMTAGLPVAFDEAIDTSISPSLKSIVIDDEGVPRLSLTGSTGLRASGPQLRNSQSVRRRNSQQAHATGHPAPTSSPSWLSFIPFFGDRTPSKATL